MNESFMNSTFIDTGESMTDEIYFTGDPDYGKLVVNFKKLHEDATIPSYATDGSAGLDCTTVTDPIQKDTYIGYKLGFSVEIPEGYVGYLFPRSSISKTDLSLSNAVGVIDSDYRGEVQARFYSKHYSGVYNDMIPRNTHKYIKGDRVCQLIIMPLPRIKPQWVDELSDSERGDGGHGSTGK